MEENESVRTIGLNTVFNNSINWKFMVPVESLPDIESFVGCYITIIVNETKVKGILKKVGTVTEKEKGEIVQVFKQVEIVINDINGELSSPDKKDTFGVPFSIELDLI